MLALLPRARREETVAAVRAAAGEGSDECREEADRAEMHDKVLKLIEQPSEGGP